MTAVLKQIDAALDMATGIVEGITPGQLSAPSLCAQWDAPGYDRGAGSIGDDVPRSIVV
jgi:hypothetical protein